MYNTISNDEEYWGTVVSISDDKKASRIKVRVETVYDLIPVESIPWAIPRYIDGSSHDLPYIGEIVYVKFMNNDINFPTWFRLRSTTENLSNDDYESAVVLTEKDLSKFGLDGKLSVRYTSSEGLLLELQRDDNTSTIIIRNDNTVFMQNGQTGRIVHISNESISIGSETKSQQPVVVGDDNHLALQKLNNTIKDLSELMNDQLKILSKVAGTSPYTRLLKVPFKTYGSKVESLISNLHKSNHNFFPETLSKISTVDKT